MPAPLTSFVGRQATLAATRRRLLRLDVRLLTLTGPGGAGKTRLALRLAGDVEAEFPDGVYFVPLAAVATADLVVPAIAQTLGVRQPPDRSLEAALTDYLAARRLLLVLDNFEHILAAAPALAGMLAAGAGFKLLVTSRWPLALYGEYVFQVPPLSLPPPDAPAAGPGRPPKEVVRSEAVQLLAERAQAVTPDFAVTDDNAPAVAAICRRLDGLPLAIELAAAWLKVLPPDALLARLESRLPMLAGGPRDADDRHRSLLAAIEWSYTLLPPQEQALFARLAVFSGGWTLDAAEAVCDFGVPPKFKMDVLAGLAALADGSLVELDATAGDEPRYTMLATIREYALQRPEAGGEADVLRRRHADYFLGFAERAERELRGPAQALWLSRLDREHDNLRAALRWSLARRDVERGLRLGGALWRFWWIRGHYREGYDWLQGFLALPLANSPPGAADRPSLQARRARALFGAGILAQMLGDEAEAQRLQETNLDIAQDLGDREAAAYALHGLARCASNQGDLIALRRLSDQSVAIFEQLGDDWGAAFSLDLLAKAVEQQGDRDGGAAISERSLALWRRLGDRQRMVIPLDRVADALARHGDPARAWAMCEESLAIKREMGDRANEVWSLTYLADLAYAHGKGDDETARSYFEQALAAARDADQQHSAYYALNRLADLALRRDDLDAARRYALDSLALAHRLEDKRQIAWCLDNLAEVALRCDAPRKALRLAGAAYGLAGQLGLPLSGAECTSPEALLKAARGRLGAAAAEAEWTQGQILPLDDAIALARSPDDDTGAAQPLDAPSESPGRDQPPPGTAPTSSPRLTPREREITALIAGGASNRQIAEQLVIADSTAERHVANILHKLGFHSRAQLAVWAADGGLPDAA